jgi:FlaA1/EpsC-like NDP-sugar epimerase
MENHDFYKNKTILITGGAGSIGKEIVKKVLGYSPEVVRIFDNNETGLFDLEQDINSANIRLLVGDMRDKERLEMALEDVDIVFHAAALKHVPLCEFNPFDAVKTNILGTQNILRVVLQKEVEKFILISTDKVVNPTNVMGATKLLAERLTISANYYKGTRKTVFSCVRFGNVMGSRGSVIPLFLKQIQRGEELTITDPEMTRFIMSIGKAVDLILKAGRIAQSGEIFILKMPSLRIQDLADAMSEEYAPEFGYKPEDISIKIVGKRPGEKMHEELISSIECANVWENDELFIIAPLMDGSGWPSRYKTPDGFIKSTRTTYSSENGDLLSKERIKTFLRDLNTK